MRVKTVSWLFFLLKFLHKNAENQAKTIEKKQKICYNLKVKATPGRQFSLPRQERGEFFGRQRKTAYWKTSR